MIKDIAEAFGPKWKNNKVQKLFSVKGREIQSIGDFFREDDIFIGVGNESLTTGDVQAILEELYSDSPYSRNILRDWERSRRKNPPVRSHKEKNQDSDADDDKDEVKRDSGLGSDSGNREEPPESRNEVIYEGKPPEYYAKRPKKHRPPQETGRQERLERERARAADEEREKARRKMRKKLEAERRALDEERKNRAMAPLQPLNDPFKRLQEEREREQQKQDAEMRAQVLRLEEEHRRERARRRRKMSKDEPKVIVVVKGENEAGGGLERKANRAPPEEGDGDSVDRKSRARPGKHRRASLKKESSVEEQGSLQREKAPSPVKETREQGSPQREKAPSPVKEATEQGSPQREKVPSPVKEATEQRSPQREKVPSPVKEATEQGSPQKQKMSSPVKETKEPKETKKDIITDDDSHRRKKSAKKDHENKENEDQKKEKDRERKKTKRSKTMIHKSKLERQISDAKYCLDKYEPGKLLGDGNFAVVKQCCLKNSGSEYAMKIIDKSKLKGKEHMIENEIEIMKLCNQVNIVKLYEEFETQQEIYLIMELVKVSR